MFVKDVEDNSETSKKGQTVTNNDYHKVYNALKALPAVKNVPSLSKRTVPKGELKLWVTSGRCLKDANPLHDAIVGLCKWCKTSSWKVENRRCLWSSRRRCQYRTSLQVGFLHRVWGLVIRFHHPVFLIYTIRITIISRSRERPNHGAKNSYIRDYSC